MKSFGLFNQISPLYRVCVLFIFHVQQMSLILPLLGFLYFLDGYIFPCLAMQPAYQKLIIMRLLFSKHFIQNNLQAKEIYLLFLGFM